MIAFLICPVVGLLTLLLTTRGMGPREQKIIGVAWALHIFAAFALVYYHESMYRGGDLFLYTFGGKQIAKFLRFDFGTHAIETLKLILHMENRLPIRMLLEGTTTGTMIGLTGFLMYLTDDSTYGGCLLVSFFALFGNLGMYRAVRHQLGNAERVPMLTGILLVPSVVFWSSGIVKEAFLLGFLGILVQGLSGIFQKRRVVGASLALVLGAYGVAMVKPYALFPLAIGTGAWVYAQTGRRVSFQYKLLSIVVVFAGVVLLTRLFPAFGLDRLGENAAQTRQNYQLAGPAGSALDFGDEGADRSLAGQLRFVPIGLINSLMRPFFFEMRNVTMGVAALEMTVILGLIIFSLRRFGAKRFIGAFSDRPYLFFCVAFVLSFGTAIGIATANLGSLSRYRAPMMPFYIGSILAIRARLAASDQQPARSPGTVRRSPAELALARRRRVGGAPTAVGMPRTPERA